MDQPEPPIEIFDPGFTMPPGLMNIGSVVQQQKTMLEALPMPVKKRLNALKNLQLKATHLEADFYREVHDLECKYHLKYHPLYELRNEIVTGRYEPSDAESEFHIGEEEKDGLSTEFQTKVNIVCQDESKVENGIPETPPVLGIPDFWLTIFKNVQLLSDMVQEHDEPILKHLEDIKIIFNKDSMGFSLEFHFAINEYFSNSVLTKEYQMKCEPEDDDPFNFEGPEIFSCKGCIIDWKKGMNVTVKTIKKKQKHKSKGSVRTITKVVRNDSFFNFFSPPTVPQDPEDLDEDTQTLLTTDFEIGHYIRERIVPHAVLYYTGEALADEEYEDEEEEEEEDDEDEEEYEDVEETGEEGDTVSKKRNSRARKPGGEGKALSTTDPANCKQQ